MSAARIVENEDDRSGWKVAEENPGFWVKVSEEKAWEYLEVLPPFYFPGGFAVSEPIRHNKNNQPVYLCVTTIRGQAYVREGTIAEATREAVALRLVLVP